MTKKLALRTAFGLQNSAVGSRIAANADLTADLDELTKLKGSLRHLVKNYTVGNPGALAAWAAAHVERPPKKKAPTPP